MQPLTSITAPGAPKTYNTFLEQAPTPVVRKHMHRSRRSTITVPGFETVPEVTYRRASQTASPRSSPPPSPTSSTRPLFAPTPTPSPAPEVDARASAEAILAREPRPSVWARLWAKLPCTGRRA